MNEDNEAYGDERSRVYKAAGGSKRCLFLLLIPHPNKAQFDRFVPYSDIRTMDLRKDGNQIWIELSELTIIVTGRNLRSAAIGIGSHGCSRLEAFDSQHRDMPTSDSEPFIEAIEFFTRKDDKPKLEKKQPKHEPETTAKSEH